MNKKFLASLITLFLLISLTCLSFAVEVNSTNAELADQEGSDAVNTVRNVVGGAENAVEDAAKDISNSSRNATEDMENGANEMTEKMTENNGGNYMAVRTSTNDNGETTLMGMTATTWTWIIMAIAAIVIIALVWYYASQARNNYESDD